MTEIFLPYSGNLMACVFYWFDDEAEPKYSLDKHPIVGWWIADPYTNGNWVAYPVTPLHSPSATVGVIYADGRVVVDGDDEYENCRIFEAQMVKRNEDRIAREMKRGDK